jgi:hypothetical protein
MKKFYIVLVIHIGLMMKKRLILSLFLCSVAFVLVSGIQQHPQYAKGIINSTTTVCVNGKCVTTTCIGNEQCRTPSNSTSSTDNSTKDKKYDSQSSAPLEAV